MWVALSPPGKCADQGQLCEGHICETGVQIDTEVQGAQVGS